MTTAKSSAAATPSREWRSHHHESEGLNQGRTNGACGTSRTSRQASETDESQVVASPPRRDPWTKAELNEVKQALTDDIARFESQIEISTAELVGLLRDGSEGAGRDPADVGSANFERDAEMSLANNAREMLEQSRLALRHIELGTYGSCDNCGQPIGKGRLQAFPRATLCVTCKQREERR